MFFILFGTALQGRCDSLQTPARVGRLRGIVFVVTQFFHVSGFPLIPLRSFAVVANPGIIEELSLLFGMGDPTAAVRIPLSFKSILLGYLRAFCALMCVAALLGGLFLFGRGGEAANIGAIAFGLALAAILAIVGSYIASGATPQREEQLKKLLSEAGVEFEERSPSEQ